MNNQDKFMKILSQAVPFESKDDVTEWKLSPAWDDQGRTEHRIIPATDYIKELQTEFQELSQNPDYNFHFPDHYAWTANCDFIEVDFEYEKSQPFHLVCFTYTRKGRDQQNSANIRWRRDYLEKTVSDGQTKFITSVRIVPHN